MVVSLDEMLVRATAGQEVAAMLIDEADRRVEICVHGCPDMRLLATVERILPVGQEQLPSAALGYAAGGSVETSLEDRTGRKAAERFFEIRIRPDRDVKVRLLAGQRVIVRFRMPDRPLATQWWRSLLQLSQRRFHT